MNISELFAGNVSPQKWISGQIPGILTFFWSVVIALIVWGLGVKLSGLIRSLIRKTMKRQNIDTGAIQFIDSLLKWLVYLGLALVVLRVFGVQTASAAAAIASLGVTAGLALQGSLSNFAGGVLILLLHPFRVGDYIIEDTHANEGTVIEITVFYTKLKSFDNKIIVIPNGTLANTSLTNVTHADKRMINLVVGISYEDDIKRAKDLLMRLIKEEPRALDTEPYRVFVSELSDSSVELGARFWVPTDEYWNVHWAMLEKIKLTFDAEGIRIPFRQMDIHMDRT